ncbi:M20 family metallo-hydrolase [Undibacter mobilis]|uniref:Zn-dependent hydrolase n=1 Tax=Undibacter mobilis TaxID=2292256 RepID=A0A371B735_9BRAD|nr:M20 family metallo-hydrolase [Undibacter mobilis]RDV03317.1 Zn-dependent hydrolase [Undibacter mobilis]
MNATALPNLRIDPERLWADLMESARIGATAKGGICRLTLTDLDRQVRDWFRTAAESLGCTVTVDDMGTMFARRAGQRNDIPPIAMGSHLDTQPTGGKFDGTLGVLAALEALRALHRAGYETFAPIEVVNWTNEEGSRFAPAMIASGVFGGVFTRDWAVARQDRAGVSFGDALEAIGYRGAQRCGDHPLSAFFEVHIEQGPYLEMENKNIGVVTGVQAIRWYDVTFTGQDSHAGTTPMHRRHDALLGAARLVETVNAIALRHKGSVGTVGVLEVKPASTNVIPGETYLTIDCRDPDEAVLDRMEQDLNAAAEAIAHALGLEVVLKNIVRQPAVHFDPQCIEAVRRGAASAGLSTRDMMSGAGHDAAYVARVAPASMIFVPCKDGISHNEAEYSSKEQCANGAQVLLQAVLDYDRTLAEKMR